MSDAGRGRIGPQSVETWPADAWRGRLLVIRLSSLGDVVLTTGALRLLRERRPDLAVDFLTRRAYAPALRGLPTVDRVLTAEETPGAQGPNVRPVVAPYDLVLDWQGGTKGAHAAARFAPGAHRVTHPRAALHRRLLVLLGRRIPPPRPYAARLARSVTGRWIGTERLRPEAPLNPALRARAADWLAAAATPAQGWVALAPCASRAMKAVPPGLVEGLTQRLRAAGWGIVRIEPPEAILTADRDPGAPELVGRTRQIGPAEWTFTGPLEEVIALLAAARLFIGSDSGILHLATAVGTPSVGLYGCTAPELGFSPLGTAAALGVDLSCRPCHIHGAHRCWLGHRACWTDLSPDQICTEALALASGGAVGRGDNTR